MWENKSLLERLQEYGKTDSYPFHMPGHKRQVDLGITSFPNPYSVDITEIDGFDNLHCPKGILREAMDQAAVVYGTDRTYFLINGSTGGILSALCGLVSRRGRLLMARNSHKSAYHAAFLKEMDTVYLYPEYSRGYGIQGGIRPESVREALSLNEDVEAVFITSPTYEGIVSDISQIADIVHDYGASLIVDEAHGAHFPFGDGKRFPRSALFFGADVVIQSIHKTLPALTQTAVLHVKGTRIKTTDIERYLQIFQSSSPSYVLLASVDNCIRFMKEEGSKRLLFFGEHLKALTEELGKKLRYLKLLSDEEVGSLGAVDRDISKIVVSTSQTSITGAELSEILRKQYRLETEMSCGTYCLLMTSFMDREDGLERLKRALLRIDEGLGTECEDGKPDDKSFCFLASKEIFTWVKNPLCCMSIAKALDMNHEEASLEHAAGRISGGFITVYPPGIPAVVPGELITEEIIQLVRYHIGMGLTVEGVSDSEEVITVGRE